MTPVARNLSIRRFTAGAERETTEPISAYEARASATSEAMIRWSTSSICNEPPPQRNNFGCHQSASLPTVSDRDTPGTHATYPDISHVSARALRRRVRHQPLD